MAARAMRGSGLATALTFLFLALLVLPAPTASAQEQIVRMLPTADGLGSGWSSAAVGCSTDATVFNEMDEYPNDGDTSCRTGVVNDDREFVIRSMTAPEAPASWTDIDAIVTFVARRDSGTLTAQLVIVFGTRGCGTPVATPVTGAYQVLSVRIETCEAAPGEFVLSDFTGTNTATMAAAAVGTGTISVTSMYLEAVFEGVPGGGGGGGGGGGPGGGGGFPTFGDENVIKLQTTDCSLFAITDVRPQAVSGILWIWRFGDGTQEITNTGTVTHNYTEDAQYTATVSVQDRSGAVQQFYFIVDTGLLCQIGLFLDNFLLPFIGVLVIAAVAVLIVFGKRLSPMTRSVLKWTIAIGGFILIIALFAGWNPFD